MSNIFVSIVGTQIMGSLHPRRAFLKSNPDGRTVLFGSSKTMDKALRLKADAEREDGGDVSVFEIPLHTGQPESVSARVIKLAEEAARNGDRLFFNVDGGLNYLIADCVIALAPFKPVLLQASESRIVAYDTASGVVEILPDADGLSALRILDLQGVAWSRAQDEDKELAQFCKSGAIDLPVGCERGLSIDGVVFDFVWNPGGNRLSFLKDCRRLPANSAECLAIERDLVHWASDRKRSGQLYDRRVYAVVRDKKSAEHLTSESGGKINVVDVSGRQTDAHLLRALSEVFKRKVTPQMEAKVIKTPNRTADSPLEDGTLIVSLGRNIVPTLLAVLSHKPRHLVLCFTNTVKDIKCRAERMAFMPEAFGLESVRLVPVSVEGNYLDLLLPEPAEGARVAINITPGTKGHGAMLAYWGRGHGCSVWSINSSSGYCVPLYAPHGEQAVPVIPCSLETRLQAEGRELVQGGSFPGNDELPLYRGLLAFMRAALDEGKDDNVLLKESVTAGGRTLRYDRQKEKCALEQGGKTLFFSVKDGEWLEKLAAVALSDAGLTDVRYRVRFKWPEEIEKPIRAKLEARGDKPEQIFSLDLDAIGSMKNDIVLISCKSGRDRQKQDIDKAADEVARTGSRLGPFSLRMLLHLSIKEPYMHKQNVMVFGWRDLCRQEKLLDLIKRLKQNQQTTED